MASENPQYIKDFNVNLPDGSAEYVDALDNFIRDVKLAVKNSFPSIDSPVNATPTELNRLVGVQSALVTVAAAQTITGAKVFTDKNAYRGVSEVVEGARNYAVAIGTDNYSATFDPVLAVYIAGAEYNIQFTNANATTTPNLSINGLPAKTLVTAGGGALVAGDIVAGQDYIIRYDGTNMRILNLRIRTNEVVAAKIANGAVTPAKLSDYAPGSYLEIGFGDITVPGTSYVKVIEFYMPRGGTVKSHIHLWSVSASLTVRARVYKNDSPLGTERTTTATIQQTFEENISFSRGDLIQLYIKSDNGGQSVGWGLFLLVDGPSLIRAQYPFEVYN